MSRVLARAGVREASVLTTEQYSPRVTAITDWLIEQGLLRSNFGTMLEGYCERLLEVDVPLWRGLSARARCIPPCAAPAARGAPAKASGASSTSTAGSSRRLRHEPVPLDDRGAASIACGSISRATSRSRSRWSSGCASRARPTISPRSWASGSMARSAARPAWSRPGPRKAPAGFAERDVAILEHMISRLGLALQARLGYEITVNLLDTYVGPEAGRRILDGEIRRGCWRRSRR